MGLIYTQNAGAGVTIPEAQIKKVDIDRLEQLSVEDIKRIADWRVKLPKNSGFDELTPRERMAIFEGIDYVWDYEKLQAVNAASNWEEIAPLFYPSIYNKNDAILLMMKKTFCKRNSLPGDSFKFVVNPDRSGMAFCSKKPKGLTDGDFEQLINQFFKETVPGWKYQELAMCEECIKG